MAETAKAADSTAIRHTLRLLDQRSLMAIIIFFLASMVSFIVLYQAMSEQREDGDGLRYAGRQGVLLQSMTSQVLRWQASDNEAEQQQILAHISAQRKNLEESSAFLLSGEAPVQIATYYANIWQDDSGIGAVYMRALDDLLAGKLADLPSETAVLDALDLGAGLYQRHYAAEVHSMELTIVFLSAMQLLLLLVIYRAVMRPMRKIVHDQMRRMQLFGKAVEQSGSMVLVTEPDGTICYANSQAILDSGYELNELIGQKTSLFKSGKTPERVYKNMWATLSQGSVWDGELMNKRKDGSVYWAQVTISPIKGDDGDLEGYLSIEHDITLVKNTLAENEEVREQLLTAIEAVDDAFALFDRNERLLLWNSRCQTIFAGVQDLIRPGISFEELIREGALRGQYGPVEDIEAFTRDRVASFRSAAGEYEIPLANGTWLLGSDRKTVDGGRVMLRVDITKLKEAEDALRVAKGQADAANQAKSAFLSSMSHELRTPLNAILGFAQMMQIMPTEPLGKQQSKCVSHILKGGKHLLDLINEVLDLAKIEAGKVEVSIEPVGLSDLIKECVSLIEANAQARGITVTIPEPKKMAWPIRADHTRAKQVVLNLLSNAVKYNSENGSITITTALLPESNMVRLTVSDTGNGIPLDKQGDVFKPFNRLGAETSDIEGTGIGLSITRQLIRLMGGEISFVSVPGEGTSFSLDFVLHSTSGEDLPEAPATGQDTAHSNVRLDLAGTVLCVEDNPANVTLLEMIFSSLPAVTLRIAHSGEDGLKEAIENRPDLVLMDINLPGMDGFDAVRELRDHPATHTLPVVAMTANAANNMVARGLAAGFSHVLIKPIVIPDLIAILENYLKGGRDETDSSASAAE